MSGDDDDGGVIILKLNGVEKRFLPDDPLYATALALVTPSEPSAGSEEEGD